jgi:hypothetical protein
VPIGLPSLGSVRHQIRTGLNISFFADQSYLIIIINRSHTTNITLYFSVGLSLIYTTGKPSMGFLPKGFKIKLGTGQSELKHNEKNRNKTNYPSSYH